MELHRLRCAPAAVAAAGSCSTQGRWLRRHALACDALPLLVCGPHVRHSCVLLFVRQLCDGWRPSLHARMAARQLGQLAVHSVYSSRQQAATGGPRF